MTHMTDRALAKLLTTSIDSLNLSERLRQQRGAVNKKTDGKGANIPNNPEIIKKEVDQANQPDPTDMLSNPIEITMVIFSIPSTAIAVKKFLSMREKGERSYKRKMSVIKNWKRLVLLT